MGFEEGVQVGVIMMWNFGEGPFSLVERSCLSV